MYPPSLARAAARPPSAPEASLSPPERELVRLSWAHAPRNAVRFDSALHAALAERLPALVALVGGSEPYAASVGRLAHMSDVAVRHVDRLLASAGGPHLPRASAAPSGPGDPVGAALLDALAACHGPRPLPDATRAAWLHAWAAMRHLLRPPAPPATAAR